MKVVVNGPPIAKKRPRFARHGKFVKVYNDQETEEGRWLFEVKNQLGAIEPLTGPIVLYADFHFPIPKSVSGKKRDYMEHGLTPHLKRPDVDNCLKFLMDCLNGYAWKDDCQIITLSATKRYSMFPCTIIEIKEINCG